MPTCAVDADLDLAWERAFGDLAVDRGPGQTSPGKDGFQADDTVWFWHGRAASCWLFLAAPDRDRTRHFGCARAFSASSYPGVETTVNRTGLESDAPASSEVDAVTECEFQAETAA